MNVSALYTYPIKSCAVLSHTRISLAARGLHDDRRWMVVNEDGKLVTQRDVSKMALVQPFYTDEGLSISAPTMSDIAIPPIAENATTRRVMVWNDTCDAFDQGDEIAAWLSDYLGKSVRLVKIAETDTRTTPTDGNMPIAPMSFADEYPILLANERSLADLNDRLMAQEKDTVLMSRFRPNVVVSGSTAWDEDQWTQINIGGITFDSGVGCARCVMTTVEQESGTVPDHKEPLATLTTFRKISRGVMFGQNIIHQTLGDLCVGDQVEVLARR